jgi:ArsR family transcriptional regulator
MTSKKQISWEDDYIDSEEEVRTKDNTSQEDLTIQDMADFSKIFGEYSRIKILECIMDIKYTVSDIACFTGLTQSAVSHHLKILKQAKIVVSERSSKYVYYIVSDKHVKETYNIIRAHVEEFQKTITAKEEDDYMAKIFNQELYSNK